MGRFSFSPPGPNLEEVVERSPWRDSKNISDNSVTVLSAAFESRRGDTDDDSESSIDSEAETTATTTCDEEEEYPHPLGFPSYGKTRFFVDPPTESAQKVRRRLGFLKNDDNDDAKEDFLERLTAQDDTPFMQTFPPLSCYTDPNTAPTSVLLSYDFSSLERPPQQQEDDLEGVTQLLQNTRVRVREEAEQSPQVTRLLHETQQVGQQLLAMSEMTKRQLEATRKDLSLKQRQLEKEHQETRDTFRLLLQRDQEAADKVLKERQAQEKAREEAEQATRKQEEKEKAERQRIADEEQKKEEAKAKQKQQRAAEAAQKRDDEQKAAAQEEAKKTEYVAKAQKRIAQLVDLRASVAPFEKSKNVSKRRLRMKKTIKGKVNTLSLDVDKIKTVADEVVQAIQLAKQEDDDLKKQIKAGNRNVSEEMIRGKRYLVDLLASDTMVRAQADGFNGTRGDGFPLANMLASVSTQVKELVPILAAHIFTICPTAIPTLPKVSKNETENELMESLGMAKGKDGEYETFDRFLARTEGLISLMAEIMASNPPDHVLMGGSQGAIDWLDRFLGLLPPPPETMPLLTAPVLDAFLTGAGHMLADKYANEFRKHLDVVTNDIVKRLDEGPIGAPSSLRLKKLVKGGFGSFKTELPSKAIPTLYNAGPYGALPSSSISFGQSQSSVAQASVAMPTAGSNSFGAGQQGSSGAFPSTAGSGTSSSSAFGAPSSSTGTSSFGQQTSNAAQQGSSSSGFGSQNQAFNPFGGGQQGSSGPFPSATGSGTSSSNPFGAPSSSSGVGASPFGQQTGSTVQQSSSSGGFGGQSQSTMQSGFGSTGAPSSSLPPSGQQTSGTTPFASQNPSTTSSSFQQQTNSFGQPAQSMAQATTSFGGALGQQSQQPSFGGAAPASSSASPFGQQSSTGFGQSQSTTQTNLPFGQTNTSAGFGSQNQSSMQTISSPSPFGQAGGSAFGAQNQPTTQQASSSPFGAQPANSPFGSVTNPFGAPAGQNSATFGTASTSAPFGTSSTSTPFGTSSSATPFGASSTATPFGAPSTQSSPFGSGGGTSFGGNQNAAVGGNQSSAFGGQQPQSGYAFGNQSGGSGKPACKFFAQGRCRYGNNCRFSHGTPAVGGAAGGSGFGGNTGSGPFPSGGYNNPFGGPRR